VALHSLEGYLGEEQMLAVLSAFYHSYRFAHPNTEDFQTVAEEVSGQDLSWFFDGLVYGAGTVNYQVVALDEHQVTVARQGELVIPTEVLVTFADESTALVPWDGVDQEKTFDFVDRAAVRSAQIDPKRRVAVDLNWGDNGLSRRLEVAPWLALVSRLVYYLQNLLLGLGGL
jgi:aminopeptidase N